jgi:pantoate--beta-alanine ligase
MGAFHDGHLSLIRAARSRCDVVVVSIFVNPLQFGPTEDLASYPRDEARDLALADREGIDVAFVPTVEEMYPEGRSTAISVGPLGHVFEGADRPGHFDGVATVVAKLFNLVGPHFTFFGQKDAQQVAVIKQLVRELSYDVTVEVRPIVREPDGLALSSRNMYLSPAERPRATALVRALGLGAEVRKDEGDEAAEKRMWDLLVSEGLEPAYARIVDPDTFAAPTPGHPALIVIAARLGRTRLIDNLLLDAEG